MGTGPSFAAQPSLPQNLIKPEPEFVELAVGGDGQYDIRRYAPHVSVNCISTSSMPEGDKYGRIAQFLGLYKPGFVQPANKAGRILARTLTKPTILSYPTPAQNKGYYYSPEFAANIFVGVQGGSIMHMPLFGYARAADVPAPTLGCINVTDVPARIIAARAYRGTFGKAISKVVLAELVAMLVRDGLATAGDELEWYAVMYADPVANYSNRVNEVWVVLSPDNPAVAAVTRTARTRQYV